MPILKDTATIDYRISLTSRGKTTAYRCVLCALADAKDRKGDLTIVAATQMKGRSVQISRVAGKWSVSPETAVFVYAEGDHQQCETRYRALTSSEAFKAYTASHPKVLQNAKLLTFAQFLKLAG